MSCLDRLYALMLEASKDEKKDEKSDKVKELEDRIEQVKKKETRGFISDEDADEQIDDIKSKLKSIKEATESKITNNKYIFTESHIDVGNIANTIIKKLTIFLKDDYPEIIFLIRFGEGSFEPKFWVKDAEGLVIDCFNIPLINKTKLKVAFLEIGKYIKSEIKKMPNYEDLYAMTIIIENSSRVKSKFHYSNDIEDKSKFISEWKDEYLNNK